MIGKTYPVNIFMLYLAEREWWVYPSKHFCIPAGNILTIPIRSPPHAITAPSSETALHRFWENTFTKFLQDINGHSCIVLPYECFNDLDKCT